MSSNDKNNYQATNVDDVRIEHIDTELDHNDEDINEDDPTSDQAVSFSQFVELRNKFDDSFEGDHASNYHLCFVLPASKGKLNEKSEGYINSLKNIGFKTFVYSNLRKKSEVYVLLQIPRERLIQLALQHKVLMPLDQEVIKERIIAGDEAAGIAGVNINEEKRHSSLSPYEQIFGPFDPNVDPSIYKLEEGAKDPFSELVTMRIAAIMLESRMPDGKENMKIQRYLRNGWLLGCFPLHRRSIIKSIQKKWFEYPRKPLAIDEMKNYFGEKIAFYFAFIEHFNRSLILPSLLGVPLQIAVWIMNDYNAPFLPFYALFMSIASVVTLENWKRKEKRIALRWGMIDFKTTENDRPDFRGKYIESYIDGSNFRFYPHKVRNNTLKLSALAVFGLIMLVIGIVACIYIVSYTLEDQSSNIQTIISFVNFAVIEILNYSYSFVANALAEVENHRTASAFEDSMINKIFFFQFVNSYSSFFFLAFISEAIGECPKNGCMYPLALNLAIIYGSKLFYGILLNIFIPYLKYRWIYKFDILPKASKITRPEKELLLEPYDVMENSIAQYSETSIQFGYTFMFITALPIAAVCSLFCNVFDILGNGWKLFNLFQRPLPKAAENIGKWQDIFLFLTLASVVTNASITFFTMKILQNEPEYLRFWLYICFQWFCFIVQYLITEFIPTVPEEIVIQTQRQDFIVRKLIYKEADVKPVKFEVESTPYKIESYPEKILKEE